MSRILFINSVCNGSTGTICKNLYKAAEKAGHECCIAYGRGEAPEGFYTIKIGNKCDIYAHVLKARLFDAMGFGSKHATKVFINQIEQFKPDIIHMHNIHGYYINIEILFNYLKKHPEIKKIWTLHDCWAFTGHCAHYLNINCYKWHNACCNCKLLSRYPKSLIDNSRFNYYYKKNLFNGVKNLELVAVSSWLSSQIGKSFLKKYPIHVKKNGIDTRIFSKYDFNEDVEKLHNKKIILGVSNIWTKEKGIDDFIQLSQIIDDDYEIMLIGKVDKKIKKKYNNIIYISNINNPKDLAKWYLRAYVFFNPTKGETFGLTNYEAQSCGTPTVTYNAGGTNETILLANSYVINNLNEFVTLLNSDSLYKLYDENVRKKMDFSSTIQSQIHMYNR